MRSSSHVQQTGAEHDHNVHEHAAAHPASSINARTVMRRSGAPQRGRGSRTVTSINTCQTTSCSCYWARIGSLDLIRHPELDARDTRVKSMTLRHRCNAAATRTPIAFYASSSPKFARENQFIRRRNGHPASRGRLLQRQESGRTKHRLRRPGRSASYKRRGAVVELSIETLGSISSRSSRRGRDGARPEDAFRRSLRKLIITPRPLRQVIITIADHQLHA